MLLNSWTPVFFSSNGERKGPIPFGELTRLAQEGELKESDLVWAEGMTDWVRADTVTSFSPKPDEGEPTTDAAEAPSAKAPVPGKANYFVRHWRGELSLPVSYWVNGILALLITTALFMGAAIALDDISTWSSIAYWSFASVVYIIACSWQIVGTWRSADRRNATNPTVWASIAKAALVLATIGVVGNLATVFGPGVSESIKMRECISCHRRVRPEPTTGNLTPSPLSWHLEPCFGP